MNHPDRHGETMTPKDEQPCASMWQVKYADDTKSHIHICDLPDKHRHERHHCKCGATGRADIWIRCTATIPPGHTCTRNGWHSHHVEHRCHCGESYYQMWNEPLILRSTQNGPTPPPSTLPN